MIESIDRDGQLKLYVQIYGIIRRLIEEGEWVPDSLIPSEDELCKIFAVSKATIRLAISDLVGDGYLKRQQGKGTFVKSPLPNSGLAMKTRLSDSMFDIGTRGVRESMTTTVREPDEEIRRFLQFDGTIFCARCKGSINGETTCVEELFVPLVYFPGIEEEEICATSFFNLVRERSIRRLSKIVQTIEASHMKGKAAELMKVGEGHPALLMHRVFIDCENRPVAYIRLFGKAGKYHHSTEFERVR